MPLADRRNPFRARDVAVTELTERYDRAMARAAELHRGQFRKASTVPYISHPMSVAATVLERAGTEDQAIAALLHDALEDTDLTEAELREEFGDRVADIVVACSDTTDHRTIGRRSKPPWRARKEAYLAHLADAPYDALLVIVADKLHNARSIAADLAEVGPALWSRFNASDPADQEWYFRSLVEQLSRRLDHPLVGQLAETVDSIWPTRPTRR
jgi:(p)ppGpp synthase/HD superfamily hydrolase